MDLEVDRRDLRRVRAVQRSPSPLRPGEARLRIDSFGLTANNITYAVFGDTMGYWQFFPVGGEPVGGEPDGNPWGRVPVWGFAEVVESAVPGVPESGRVYGYFPMAEELVVRPGRVDERGFSDVVAHREVLPSVYNRYSFTGTDPVYRRDREAQQMLLWPLFVTSFVVDDFLGDHGMFGSTDVVVSSASAKTSIAAAFLVAQRGDLEVVGLTSATNLDFVRSLGCYDRTGTYEDVASLPVHRSCYIDIAGRRDVTGAVHDHFGESLGYSMVVGDTHWEDVSPPDAPLTGPKPVFLFAPDQIAKRRRDWGRDGFEQRVAAAWDRFVPWTDRWMTLRHAYGPADVERAYRDLLDGRVDPHVGDVCTLSGRRPTPTTSDGTDGQRSARRD
ncbi:MAG: DUF2855 family protein [Acidimicrobiales bacterium]